MVEKPESQPEQRMPDDKQEAPRDRLFRLHDEMCKRAKALMRKKNEDYGRSGDPLFNFRRHGLKGIVVRMDDKMCRLDNFVEKGFLAVEDEPVDNVFDDLINYCVLAAFWREEQKRRLSA